MSEKGHLSDCPSKNYYPTTQSWGVCNCTPPLTPSVEQVKGELNTEIGKFAEHVCEDHELYTPHIAWCAAQLDALIAAVRAEAETEREHLAGVGAAAARRAADAESRAEGNEGVIWMVIHRIGGMVEGRPTERVNFLQRIDQLVAAEATVKAQAEEIKRLRLVLEWLDMLGGLGNDKHGRIRAALKGDQ